MPRPGGTTARGYGTEHQRIRAALLPEWIGKPCTRCGKPMFDPDAMDLDHDDHDRGRYRGFSHMSCNRSAGGKKRAAMRRRVTVWRTSRSW